MGNYKEISVSGKVVGMIVLVAASCCAQSYTVSTVAGASGGLDVRYGLVVDGSGNIYFSDPGSNVIRKLAPSGSISIYAGDPKNDSGGYYGDHGPAVGAGLNGPNSLALDADGNLYISDLANNRVRKVSSKDGSITTVAGGGTLTTLGGQATQTFILLTAGLAVDDRRHALADALTARGVERCPAIGAMRIYDVPWDGLFAMDRLVRWVSG